VRKATCVSDRVFGVNRSVCLAGLYRPAYLLSFLLILIPHPALAQSNAEWIVYKRSCGVPASTTYSDWLAQGSPCAPSNGGGTTNAPVAAGLTPQQQLAVQGAAQAGNMIGQALGQWLFGSPAPPQVPTQPDPEQQQRQLAAQQLNNSGLYLIKQKNYAGAINEFQKALANTPNDPNILHNLALAKQRLKDAAVAGQTSRALGQFLGNTPANTGLFGFAQLTGSTAANSNVSALSLVNLDSDANVVDLRGATSTAVAPEALKNQIDGALGNAPTVAQAPEAQTGAPQAQDIDKLFQAAISVPATQPEIKSPKMDAEHTTKELDEALGQDQSARTHQPESQVVGGNAPGSADANAGGHQPSAHGLDGVANPDFDGSTTGNAPIVIGHPTPLQSGVDLRDAGTTTVAPARVKGWSVSNGGSEPATPAAFAKSLPGLGGISAPGSPIFDCSGDAATIKHLLAGLPVQQEAIRRTEAALDAAREDARDDSAEAREKWIEGTIKMLASTANSIAGSSERIMAREGALTSAGISPKEVARFKFLEKIKQIHELSEKLEGAGKVYDAAVAGKAFGDTVLIQKTARDLTDLIAEAGVLLVDSGIAEEAGGKLALALWGPIGELGFEGVTTGLDLLTATSTGFISAAEADRAALNLEVMQSEYQRIQGRIYDLQQELGQGCSKKSH
jgi:tetratricopeptide (TPR) repeat protein